MIQKLLANRIVRFLLGGSVTVVCEYVVFYVLYVLFHWNLLVANSLSFGVGLGISFLFNRLWAFKQDNFRRKVHHQLLMYIALAATNLVFNNLIVAGLKDFGLDPRIGKIVAIVAIAVWNFLLYKSLIFNSIENLKRHDSNQST